MPGHQVARRTLKPHRELLPRMASSAPANLDDSGLEDDARRDLEKRVGAVYLKHNLRNPTEQTRAWIEIQRILMTDARWRWAFEAHRRLYKRSYDKRPAVSGPGPAWVPPELAESATNLTGLAQALRTSTYANVHRWSIEHREEFWADIIRRLGIVFHEEPARIFDAGSSPTEPVWLPRATMNIAESCFGADPGKVAIVSQSEGDTSRAIKYGELRRLCGRVANGLEAMGVPRSGRVAIYMPMTPESVAVYLGTILSGRTIVGIADASAPQEFEKRARIGEAKAVFTTESYRRAGKDLPVYDKVVRADGPPAIVLPPPGRETAKIVRAQDRAWDEFLGRESFEPAPCRPDDATNILFSSGTTKDPKAIVWTHMTPIKSAADAYFHHDVHSMDVLAWPTSFGWMMGPWLTYASLVNRATMALYVGDPQSREFGKFVEEAGVTMLGVVPKLVRAWMDSRAMEGLDWGRVRLFSSTAEPSTPDEMLYLMFLAGYKPIIEYCGGTEVGGGYLTGTLLQPCAPATFTTPAMGMDLVILDGDKVADRGEVFLIPPSIGLSNKLLNYDNEEEYYAGVPAGPHGEMLRRHGDRIERLGGGFFRHLGRADDTININGVKTSSEEIRTVLANPYVYDAKPIAVDIEGTGQASLVVYAVPRDVAKVKSKELRDELRTEFERAIKERLNPLLAHVHDVVLVSELPQAGPGKTRTMKELQTDYRTRSRTS